MSGLVVVGSVDVLSKVKISGNYYFVLYCWVGFAYIHAYIDRSIDKRERKTEGRDWCEKDNRKSSSIASSFTAADSLSLSYQYTV